jgi:bifunctional non-homologous end joining protein LigD
MPGHAAGQNPAFIEPMLATAIRQLPADAIEYVAEIKWDGMRAVTAISGGRIRIWSRTGRDLTGAYPELGALAAAAGRRTLVLDGEIVVLAGARPDFTALQKRMTAGIPSARLLASVPVTLIVFDVIEAGRRSLLREPYVLRRALLEDLGVRVPGIAEIPPAFPGDAVALLNASRDQGYEGIMLKRPNSLYHPGRRTREWLKMRNIHAIDVRVGGWLPGSGGRRNLAGSVLMGIPEAGALEFAGTVGSGLSMAESRELTTLLESLEQPDPPFASPVPSSVARQARWVRPVLVAEVDYLEITPSGRLRHPIWRGLRHLKPAPERDYPERPEHAAGPRRYLFP